MKKISLLVMTLFLATTVMQLSAQCVINQTNTVDGFTPTTLPCVTQGTPYSEVIQVHLPAAVTSPFPVNIDSFLLLSITGMPSGITYSVNPASPRAVRGGGNGCILFSGTSNAAVNNYPLSVNARVWLQGIGSQDLNLSTLGYSFSLDVCAQGGGGGGCDTITNLTTADSTITYFTFNAPASGYLSGNNSYADVAKAEKFGSTAGNQLTGAFLLFGRAKSLNPTRTVTIRAYDSNGTNGAPGTTLASVTVPISTLITDVTNGNFTLISFPTQPTLPNDSFFVGVVLPTTAGDTVVLYTTDGSTTSGRGWELQSNLQWFRYSAAYAAPAGNAGHFMFVSVCTPTTSTPPVANFSANSTTGCAPLTVQFTDQSTNTPTSWSWTFTGASVTSSTSQNPIVTYNTPGSYNVTLTATNGSGSDGETKTSYITVYAKPTVTLTKTDATCSQGGSVTTSVSGGAGFTYLWSNNATTTNLTNVSAGNYTVTVTNSNGCTGSASTTIGSAGGISVSLNKVNASCGLSNGSITTTPSGGTGYTYLWSNNATTQNLSALAAGTYTVTVTASNGCTATSSAIVTTTSGITVTLTKTDAACAQANGSITSSVSGGSGYAYLWSNNATTQNLNALGAGTYTLTVTASSGCSASASATVNTSSGNLAASAAVGIVPNCGQSNGTATVTASGGTPGYTYRWSTSPTQTSATATNISAGAYTITVTDNAGCTTTATLNVGNVGGPTALIQLQTNVSCHGGTNGSVALTATGGSAPYNYSSNGVNFQSSSTFSGLSTGSYAFYVRDANNCVSTTGTNITEPTPITISFTKTDVTCFGGNTGNATANVSGGTPTYNYNWSNSQSGVIAVNLTAASYSLAVMDDNGCTASSSVTISQPSAALSAPVSTSDVSCFGGADGSALVNASGGTTPYSYQWSSGQNNPSVSSLSAGSIGITVTDSKGCTVSGSGSVSQPTAALSATATGDNSTCNGSNNGSITTTVAGGTTPYDFDWSNGSSAQNPSGLDAGSYTLTIQDANGCTVGASATLTEPAPLNLSTSSTDASSSTAHDGSASVAASGGTMPYSYHWSNSVSNAVNNGIAGGSYSVTVTDANGCSAVSSVVVDAPPVGITEAGLEGSVSIFPNPTKDLLFLDIKLNKQKDVQVEIVNVVGAVVITRDLKQTTETRVQFDMSGFADGIYFVRIKSEDGGMMRKIVVAK